MSIRDSARAVVDYWESQDVNLDSLSHADMSSAKAALSKFLINRISHSIEASEIIDDCLTRVQDGISQDDLNKLTESVYITLDDGRVLQFERFETTLRIWLGEEWEDVPLNYRDQLYSISDADGMRDRIIELRDRIANFNDDTRDYLEYCHTLVNCLSEDVTTATTSIMTGLQSSVAPVRDLATLLQSVPAENRISALISFICSNVKDNADSIQAQEEAQPDSGAFNPASYESYNTSTIIQGAYTYFREGVTALSNILMIVGTPFLKAAAAVASFTLQIVGNLQSKVQATERMSVSPTGNSFEFANAVRFSLPRKLNPEGGITSLYGRFDDRTSSQSSSFMFTSSTDYDPCGFDNGSSRTVQNFLMYPKAYLRTTNPVAISKALIPLVAADYAWEPDYNPVYTSNNTFVRFYNASAMPAQPTVRDALSQPQSASYYVDLTYGTRLIGANRGLQNHAITLSKVNKALASNETFSSWDDPTVDLSDDEREKRAISLVGLNYLLGLWDLASTTENLAAYDADERYGEFSWPSDGWRRTGDAYPYNQANRIGAAILGYNWVGSSLPSSITRRQSDLSRIWTVISALDDGSSAMAKYKSAYDLVKTMLSSCFTEAVASMGFTIPYAFPPTISWAGLNALLDGDVSFAYFSLTDDLPSQVAALDQLTIPQIQSLVKNKKISISELLIVAMIAGIRYARAIDRYLTNQSAPVVPPIAAFAFADAAIGCNLVGYVKRVDGLSVRTCLNDGLGWIDSYSRIVTDPIVTPPKFQRGSALAAILVTITALATVTAIAIVSSYALRKHQYAKMQRREAEAEAATNKLKSLNPKTQPAEYKAALTEYTRAQRRFQRTANRIGYSSNSVGGYNSGTTPSEVIPSLGSKIWSAVSDSDYSPVFSSLFDSTNTLENETTSIAGNLDDVSLQILRRIG